MYDSVKYYSFHKNEKFWTSTPSSLNKTSQNQRYVIVLSVVLSFVLGYFFSTVSVIFLYIFFLIAAAAPTFMYLAYAFYFSSNNGGASTIDTIHWSNYHLMLLLLLCVVMFIIGHVLQRMKGSKKYPTPKGGTIN